MNRTQRCGTCTGCNSQACGTCIFCKDNPHFGGPGIKKQSCVNRRCVRVLEYRLTKEIAPHRVKGGCGRCDECKDADCGLCLVCMDKLFFDGKYLPGALCFKKKCRNPSILEIQPSESPAYEHRTAAEVPRRIIKTTKKLPGTGKRGRKKLVRDVENDAEEKITVSKKLKPNYYKPKKPAEVYHVEPRDQQRTADPQTKLVTKLRPTTPLNFTSKSTNAIERAFLNIMRQNSYDQSPKSDVEQVSAEISVDYSNPNSKNNNERQQVVISSASVVPTGEEGLSQSPTSNAAELYSLYRSLPKATLISSDSKLPCWEWPPSKVLYPTSVETVPLQIQVGGEPSSQQQNALVDGGGYIVSLDSDQLLNYCTTGSSSAPGTPSRADKNAKQLKFIQDNNTISVYQQNPNAKQVIRVGSSPTVGHRQAE